MVVAPESTRIAAQDIVISAQSLYVSSCSICLPIGSARPERHSMARGPSGQSHGPLARQDFEQGARSRDGTFEVHERRRHGLRGAGADFEALTPRTFPHA
jgi:hypothetical protein